MTRINADLKPELLLDQHLMAEYRELPMVFASLSRSMRSRSVKSILSSIPEKFTLNKGHVTFFYDKLLFLHNRYERLVNELYSRGYCLSEDRETYDYTKYPKEFQNNWYSTKEEDLIVVKRILEKHKMKPNWYKYKSDPIHTDLYRIMLTS